VEEDDEPPGWYRARVTEYFQDESCKVIILEVTVLETINLYTVEYIAAQFTPLLQPPYP